MARMPAAPGAFSLDPTSMAGPRHPVSMQRPGDNLSNMITVRTMEEHQNLARTFGAAALLRNTTQPNGMAQVPYQLYPEALNGPVALAPQFIFEALNDDQGWLFKVFPVTDRMPERIELTQILFRNNGWDPAAELSSYRIHGHRVRSYTQGSSRHSRGFSMEIGYLGTAKGLQFFWANMLALAKAAAVTAYSSGLRRLLENRIREPRNKYEVIGTPMPTAFFREAAELEIDMWGALNYVYYGLSSLVAIARQAIAQSQIGTMNMLVLPYNVASHIARLPENSQFLMTGRKSGGDNDRNPKGFLGRMHNIDIVESQLVLVEETGVMEDLLSRPTTVGEFFLLTSKHLDTVPIDKRRIDQVYTHVYDFRPDVDDWCRISWLKCLDNSGLFGADGSPSDEIGKPFLSGYPILADYLHVHHIYDEFRESVESAFHDWTVREIADALIPAAPAAAGGDDDGGNARDREGTRSVFDPERLDFGARRARQLPGVAPDAPVHTPWYNEADGGRILTDLGEIVAKALPNMRSVAADCAVNLVESVSFHTNNPDEAVRYLIRAMKWLRVIDTAIGVDYDGKMGFRENATIIARSLATANAKNVMDAVLNAVEGAAISPELFIAHVDSNDIEALSDPALTYRAEAFMSFQHGLSDVLERGAERAKGALDAILQPGDRPQTIDDVLAHVRLADLTRKLLIDLVKGRLTTGDGARQKAMRHGVMPIFDFLIARNQHTWLVADCIALDGVDFGYTGINNVNFMANYDTMVKRYNVHGTMYLGTYVMKEGAQRTLPASWLYKPLYGEGCRFWDPMNPADRDAYARGDITKDLFAIPLYPGEADDLRGNMMDLTGFFPRSLVSDDNTRHYAMHRAFCATWGINHNQKWYMPWCATIDCTGENTRLFRGQQTFPLIRSDGGQDVHGFHVKGGGHFSKSRLRTGHVSRIRIAQAGYGVPVPDRLGEPRIAAVS